MFGLGDARGGVCATAISPFASLAFCIGASMLNPPMPGAIDGRAAVKGAEGDCKGEEGGFRCGADKIKSSILLASIPAAFCRG